MVVMSYKNKKINKINKKKKKKKNNNNNNNNNDDDDDEELTPYHAQISFGI